MSTLHTNRTEANEQLFIAHQYYDDMNEEFVGAAALEAMRLLPGDFFYLEDYADFYQDMRAYLMK